MASATSRTKSSRLTASVPGLRGIRTPYNVILEMVDNETLTAEERQVRDRAAAMDDARCVVENIIHERKEAKARIKAAALVRAKSRRAV